MQRFVWAVLFTLTFTSELSAQQPTPKKLTVACAADKAIFSPSDSVNLTVSLENRGSSDVYIYRTLEWVWAGVGYRLTNDRGDVLQPRERIVPLPPLPLYDKSDLVGLHPGYFFGTPLVFDLSHYKLSPGVYYVQVLFWSNYHKEDGFGLPIFTFDDGEFPSNKVRIEVHSGRE